MTAQSRPLEKLSRRDLQENIIYDAFVHFGDKGPMTNEMMRKIRRDLLGEFSPHALARRQKIRPPSELFDLTDFPVYSDYIDTVQSMGAQTIIQSRWFNGVSIRADLKVIRRLEALTCVDRIDCFHVHRIYGKSPAPKHDPARVKPPVPKTRSGYAKKQLQMLGIDRLHQRGYDGRGIRLAIIDCGFDLSHKAFNNPQSPLKLIDQWDFVNNDNSVLPEKTTHPEQYEHGSYVLGLIAGNVPGEFMGSAPSADLMLYHAEDGNHEYYLEEYWFAAALERAERMGADLVTTSLVLYGGYRQDEIDGKTAIMTQAMNHAIDKGLVCVGASGNSGNDTLPDTSHLTSPGDSPLTITVGAIDTKGKTADFSSDGKMVLGTCKPELMSLGKYPITVSLVNRNGYTYIDGTSVATPILAGAVACLMQVHPQWTRDALRKALFKSGDEYRKNGRCDPNYVCGYGIPDFFIAAGFSD